MSSPIGSLQSRCGTRFPFWQPSRMVLLGSLVCHMPSKALSGESGDGRLAQAASTTCCCLTWLAGLANKLPSAQLEELLEMLRPLLQPQWNLAKADSLIGVTKGLLFRGYPFLGHYTHMVSLGTNWHFIAHMWSHVHATQGASPPGAPG